MGKMLSLGFATVLICLCSAFCSGQCADDLQGMVIHCDGPDDCHDNASIWIPQGSEDGFSYGTEGVPCCGQLITSVYQTGGCFPILKNAGLKKQLTELAKTADVLIADCHGHYTLFEPGRFESPDKRILSLLTDRILR
jgi:hypothetical protein